MKRDANKYNVINTTFFLVFSIGYIIAILTCFIVNLAVNHKLTWLFLVLSGCLCGFTFVPTLLRFFEKRKLLVFVCSTYVSLSLLFLTCSIYTSNFWCFIAMVGTLLGYFAFFHPFGFVKLKAYIKEEKYKKLSKYFLLSYAFGLLFITLSLLLVINGYYKFDVKSGLTITLYGYLPLFIYGIIELLSIKRSYKVSIDSFITGGFLTSLNYV